MFKSGGARSKVKSCLLHFLWFLFSWRTAQNASLFSNNEESSQQQMIHTYLFRQTFAAPELRLPGLSSHWRFPFLTVGQLCLSVRSSRACCRAEPEAEQKPPSTQTPTLQVSPRLKLCFRTPLKLCNLFSVSVLKHLTEESDLWWASWSSDRNHRA